MDNASYISEIQTESYNCWLQYKRNDSIRPPAYFSRIVINGESQTLKAAAEELKTGISQMTGIHPQVASEEYSNNAITLCSLNNKHIQNIPDLDLLAREINDEGYIIKSASETGTEGLQIIGKTDTGVLYGVFHLLRLLQEGSGTSDINIIESPKNQLRMINHWDNMDGSIERGYAGGSIFYKDGQCTGDARRIKDYARLMSSIGINGISINNVNVHEVETKLITEEFLPEVAKVADIFRIYGIRTFLSINYASPMQIGGLGTADPLDPNVREWWNSRAEVIYRYIPDFGGFVVKADSEHRPGPFTYNRTHADGANMLARALEPFGGTVIWRCFVYNCLQDWRDRKTDRAKAAFDHFMPLDGEFLDNVILQIKNGPMDFQVREPVSPLFGAMPQTNQVLEFQITQEYTGQQVHLCYLIPQWKEVLDFDTYARGKGSYVKRIVDGSLYPYKYSGITAVTSIGMDENWTGHPLAQANLYGYGRLIWNPDLSEEEITNEWVVQTFGHDQEVKETVKAMLAESWRIYENYTSPLGVGWMVNPHHHYGPNVDGYEYSVWGTYHFADCHGIGVNRTLKDGTGYTSQYFEENFGLYESVETCPDELLCSFTMFPILTN